jgi:FkbH-like protein
MKFLLLSNVNMQPLVRLMKPHAVACGTYNSLLADLSTKDSVATAEDVTHLLCLFDTDALMGEAFYGNGAPDQCDMLLTALDDFCGRHPDKVIITNTFCLGSNRPLGLADFTHRQSLKALEGALNARLADIARARSNLLVIDIELLFRRHGEDALVSDTFWYAGRIRYTSRMFALLAETIGQALAAFTHQNRKVIIVDLDNTLWGGIVGEAGPLGIELSEDGKGRCYRDFQRALKAIKRTGVLLAIASKNNAADVDEVFDRNPMMILRREDFAVVRANWQPKAENIADIAKELDLGTDSLVFIDDNPVERGAIAKFLPEVAVPAFPDRIENLPSWFMRDVVPVYFGKYAITAEDTAKTEQYQAKAAREKLAASFDLDGYLAELGIECKVHVDDRSRLVRAAQMTQKTNQYNLTTRRYDVTDLARFVESVKHAVLMLEYRDRFGDEGAVALAIVDLAEGRIDTLLASCRIIGRKVERQLLDKAVELCRERGLHKILGEYIPTPKNGMAASFYEDNGFKLLKASAEGGFIYERAIDER